MSRESIVFLLGLLVIITPHLGLPASFKLYLLTVSGVLIMFLAYSLRRLAYLRSLEHAPGERQADSFAEHTVATDSASSIS